MRHANRTPLWPELIDLDPGELARFSARSGPVSLRLIAVTRHPEPDRYIRENPARFICDRATVDVEVDGTISRLAYRPYQLPTVHGGLRLAVEAVAPAPESGFGVELMPVPDFQKTVRLAVLEADAPWGPPELVFPIADYRWGAASYQNTWGALVPYNALYYHRGEDFGAIPDRLPVVAMAPGRVLRSPHTHGRATASNSIAIAGADGTVLVYGHINYDSIPPEVIVGAEVTSGQRLGLTGDTWNGARCQHQDPHLHVALHHADPPPSGEGQYRLGPSLYPALVAAYFRTYPDALIANAGGYRYGLPGATLTLDGTCSVARPGEEIASWEWRLHDGSRQPGPLAQVTYREPGLYTEELIVHTRGGAEDRAFAQVRIYDPAAPIGEVGFGWFYHQPVRGLTPGQPVLFWNRLDPKSPAASWIDFGDGTPPRRIAAETLHAYLFPGLYTASLRSTGPRGEPLTVRLRVVVEVSPHEKRGGGTRATESL